jgi:hypothetical protein
MVRAILLAIAALALVVPALVVRYAPPPAPRPYVIVPQRPVVAKTELPTVEPLELQDMTPAAARVYNAGIPFVVGPNPAARPFHFAGDAAQLARATDCLAVSLWYEAGDDPVGQKAVAQVVLNRLRHPAFPKTVCGVVFQGAERSTGCQFTFTCDGAMLRVWPGEEAWTRARKIAADALDGAVFRKVGYATHYHTDWVVPYWSSSLDKLAEVHTHLFFRWTGWWGTPGAFHRAVSADEPVIAALARLSDAHRMGGALAEADAALAAAAPYAGPTPTPVGGDPNTFVVALDATLPEIYPAMAEAACADRAKCKVMGWTDRAVVPATARPTPQQLAAMSFSYLRDRDAKFERTLWNCEQFPRPSRTQCMLRQVTPVTAITPAPSSPLAQPPRGPGELEGVRHRTAPLADSTAGKLVPVTPPRTSPAATP